MATLQEQHPILVYRMRVLRQALNLEIKGMRRRGQSAFAQIKQEFGLTGSRVSVLNQFDALIANAQDAEYPDLDTADAPK